MAAARGDADDGLSLIELLVVVVVLAVLAAVVLVAVRGAGDKGREAAYGTDVDILRNAEEVYFTQHARYGTEADLVVGGLLATESSLHEVEVGDPPLTYRITCRVAPGCGSGGAIVRGGTLAVAATDLEAGGGILNPAVTTDGAVHTNAEPLFNGLVGWNAKNEPVAELAESWDTGDLRTQLFTLRPDMVWHDGSPITAGDVEFTFEQALLKYHSRTSGSLGPALGVVVNANPDLTTVPPAAITLPDGPAGRRVQFNFAYPYPALLRQLNVTEAPILPAAHFGACATAGTLDDTQTNPLAVPPTAICPENLLPVASGPFRFIGIDPDTGVMRMARNDRYFRKGLPFLDELQLRALPSDLLAAALTGARTDAASVDWAGTLSAADVDAGAKLAANEDVTIARASRGSGGTNCMVSLAFNLWVPGTTAADISSKPVNAPYDHSILKTASVRQAMAMAMERERTFEETEYGQGRIADSPYHSSLAAAHQSQALPAYDPAGARSLLQGAGWLDPSAGADPTATRLSDGRPGLPPFGTPLVVENRYLAAGAQAEYATQLVDDLRLVGVDVTAVADPDPSLTIFADRTFDTAWLAYCHGEDPAIGVRRQYHSDDISAKAFTNAAGYRNATMDGRWDDVVVLPSSSPTYRTLHGQIQAQAAADLPYVWVTEVVNVIGHRSACKGFNTNNTGLFAEAAWCVVPG